MGEPQSTASTTCTAHAQSVPHVVPHCMPWLPYLAPLSAPNLPHCLVRTWTRSPYHRKQYCVIFGTSTSTALHPQSVLHVVDAVLQPDLTGVDVPALIAAPQEAPAPGGGDDDDAGARAVRCVRCVCVSMCVCAHARVCAALP